ncbi:MAG: 4'-phosphopantetheinyl transferase superfamily protein [Candidatus Neptunochlamydia sp.]|nr:4'-phosphopantetheinyl transferase superfamily protein [Candidatus Neptunochlamydia sp.]
MIKVFHIPFRNNAHVLAGLKEVLNDEEIKRADRFIFKQDQSQFIYFRAVLRGVLGEQLSCHPKDIYFKYSSKGKPFLDPFYHTENLFFNLSHTKMFALIAVSDISRVGIDVEYSRPVPHLDRIMKTTLSLCEQSYVQSLPKDERSRAFLRYWTKKEALLKAIGKGLECNQMDYTFGDCRKEANSAICHGSAKWIVQNILGSKICAKNNKFSSYLVNELCRLNCLQSVSTKTKVEHVNNQMQRYIAAIAYEGTPLHIRHIYIS